MRARVLIWDLPLTGEEGNKGDKTEQGELTELLFQNRSGKFACFS